MSNVDDFLGFFQKKCDAIHSLVLAEDPEATNLFKRILYMAIIDALSKTVYPRRKNRDRFVSFVRKFSNWQHMDKISIPHLVGLVEKTPDPEFSDLRNLAYSEIGRWKQGDPIYLDRDLDEKQALQYWPKQQEYQKPIEGVSLEFLKHAQLLYAYRNTLIHEMREPGHGMDFNPGDTEPYYHSMSHGGLASPKKMTWELVYPVGFTERICTSAMGSLKDYYVTERINPYDWFDFGTSWIQELNR